MSKFICLSFLCKENVMLAATIGYLPNKITDVQVSPWRVWGKYGKSLKPQMTKDDKLLMIQAWMVQNQEQCSQKKYLIPPWGSSGKNYHYFCCLPLSTHGTGNWTLDSLLQLEESNPSAAVLRPIHINFPSLPLAMCKIQAAMESGNVAFAVQPIEYRKTC